MNDEKYDELVFIQICSHEGCLYGLGASGKVYKLQAASGSIAWTPITMKVRSL